VLVGDGPLSAQLRKRNVGYVIAGRLVNGKLSAHYASGDIFLFPSTTETFGNVTLEAMASGLAIVAYRYAAARQHLVDGRSALLPPFDDTAAFVAAARRMVRDLPLARALGAEARQAAQPLTWERIVGDFEQVLADVAH
jgi:glycosyltransferase involved in cell wall biosynthesis